MSYDEEYDEDQRQFDSVANLKIPQLAFPYTQKCEMS